MSDNPYAAPEVEEILGEDTPDVLLRKEFVKQETSLKSIAYIDYLAVFIMLVGTLDSSPRNTFASDMDEIAHYMGIILVMGLLIWAGISIRKLRTPGRVLNVILFGIMLIAFPIGTLFGAYALYLLLGPKSRIIFSADYREVITRTPDVKYQTSTLSWIVLILLLFAIAFLVVGAIAMNRP